MTNITDIKSGLATNLGNIPRLRVSAQIPDNPQPPVAIINLDGLDYDLAMAQGLTLARFTVQIIVARADARSAQNRLDGFVSNSGASSVKSAVELDRTLGGIVQDLRVVSVPNIGSITMSDQIYLAADFEVAVYF